MYPHLIHGLLDPLKSTPKQHLDLFSRLRRVHICGQHIQTHRQIKTMPPVDFQTTPTDLHCKSVCRLLLSTYYIARYYYYPARKLMLILPFHGGWKAQLTW